MSREYRNGAVQVGTEPTMICIIGQGISQCTLQNISERNVFIGGSHVAADGDMLGFRLNPGDSVQLDSYESDASELYAVIARTKTKTKKAKAADATAEKDSDDDSDESPTATIVFLVSS